MGLFVFVKVTVAFHDVYSRELTAFSDFIGMGGGGGGGEWGGDRRVGGNRGGGGGGERAHSSFSIGMQFDVCGPVSFIV